MAECSIDGCPNPARARAWCIKHYRSWQRHGDPLGSAFADAETQFWKKVDKTDNCWIWTAATYTSPKARGAGFFNIKRDGKKKPIAAREVAWEYINGPVPDGMSLTPHCLNDECVRPDHFALASAKQHQENRRGAQSNSFTGVRGVSPFRGKFRATVGHYGQQVHVGVFDTIEAAEAAVIAKRVELFTHDFADRQRLELRNE
ncbi:HNH endonuclease [Mycolicibacterium sp.]|uniref:HNH endonuclease n=1 Tax=Mycolicibacterium sp. TaxID=2320850 RepID=UPI0037C9E84E